MFCKNCGKEIAEGQRFCVQCGTLVAEEPKVEQPVLEQPAEEPVAEPALQEQTVQTPAEETVFAQPQFEMPVPKPKKKLSALFVAAIAVILAAVVAASAFVEPIKGLAVKTFGSDADYLHFVDQKAVNEVSDEIVEAYGDYLENLDKTGRTVDMSVQLNVGDKAVTLLENALKESGGPTIDFDWLENIAFDLDANMQEKAMQFAIAAKLNGTALANADLIWDMDKSVAYVAVLSMNEKYLKLDLQMEEDMQAAMSALSLAELKQILPSEKTLDKLIDKYTAIVYEGLKNVEKSSEVVSIGDIEQKLTTLEVEIDWQTARDIMIAVLETAKQDEDLKQIIQDVAKYLEENDQIDDASGIYDDFRDGIADAIDELQKEEPENVNEKLRMVSYVNSAHEVVGRKFTFDGESGRYITVRDGANFAFEMKAGGYVKITGEGTEKKDVVNGKFTCKVENKTLCELTLTDLVANEEQLTGKILITPSSELLESVGLDSMGASMVSLANPELELVFDNKKDAVKTDINLLSGKEMLIGFTITAKEAKETEIKMPDTGKVLEQEKVNEWLQSFDFEGLKSKLEDAGVPSELLKGVFG